MSARQEYGGLTVTRHDKRWWWWWRPPAVSWEKPHMSPTDADACQTTPVTRRQ